VAPTVEDPALAAPAVEDLALAAPAVEDPALAAPRIRVTAARVVLGFLEDAPIAASRLLKDTRIGAQRPEPRSVVRLLKIISNAQRAPPRVRSILSMALRPSTPTL